jgi:putative nucleotidyltransferase with HDIG domain
MLTRDQAVEILQEYTKSENLRKHALAVESCVAAYARKLGQDENKWSVTALLHDFDYEMHPEAPDHPMKGEPILAARGVPEEIRRAILSHANYSGVPRESALEKTLFACDELAGFITAISLVKPGRSVHEVDTKSVRKKMKDKAFARSVSREDIVNGAAALGVDLDEHVEFCIRAMQGRAQELGVGGEGVKSRTLLLGNQLQGAVPRKPVNAEVAPVEGHLPNRLKYFLFVLRSRGRPLAYRFVRRA